MKIFRRPSISPLSAPSNLLSFCKDCTKCIAKHLNGTEDARLGDTSGGAKLLSSVMSDVHVDPFWGLTKTHQVYQLRARVILAIDHKSLW